MGIFGPILGGTHVSYHTDGTHHTRLSNIGRDTGSSKKDPITSIKKWTQINATAVDLTPATVASLAEPYEKSGSFDHEVFLSSSVLGPRTNVCVGAYLVAATAEQQFIGAFNAWYSANRLKLVAINIFQLDCFGDMKVAIVLSSNHQPQGQIADNGPYPT